MVFSDAVVPLQPSAQIGCRLFRRWLLHAGEDAGHRRILAGLAVCAGDDAGCFMQERTLVIGTFRRCVLCAGDHAGPSCRRGRRLSAHSDDACCVQETTQEQLEETMLLHAGEDADYWRIQAVCAVSRR